MAIDEHGDRQFELVTPAVSTTSDASPAISPDRRWMVFCSTRGAPHGNDETGLWIAPLAPEATPRPLVPASGIDSHPMWTHDGRAIIFASTRGGGDFDLWRLAIDGAGSPGELTRLTTGSDHEITPTIAPDGTIVYAAVSRTVDGEVTSRLEERAPDGTIRTLTDGPADRSPAFSPDGTTLVFVRPAIHLGVAHFELWQMARHAEFARQLVALPLTDESGPVWSPDGRFVFATSVLRGVAGKPLFSSIVHVDLQEPRPRARILGDRAGPVARSTPAIAARQLDVAALHDDPEYLPELARIMARTIAEQTAR